MKKALLIFIKIVITILVFWWVIHKLGPGGLQQLWSHMRTARPLPLAGAVAVFVFAMSLGVYRWRTLLQVQGIHLSPYQATWITAVGMFFNTFLIGATGGDVLKAWYAAKAAPSRKPQAVLSILVDRLIGLLGLFLVATLSVLTNWSTLLNNAQTQPLALLVMASLLGALIVVALSTQRSWITSRSWWNGIWRFIPAKNLFTQLSESYNAYGRHPRMIALTLLLSMGVHICMVVATWLIGEALNIRGVGWGNYFVYSPMINTFAAIPVTIGGLGLRESAFKFFFSMQGVPDDQSVTLSLLFYATSLAVNLAAGFLFLLGKPREFRAASAPGLVEEIAEKTG